MKIVWLASYPKSGNTWCRAFLLNLQSDAQEPVSINALNSIPVASDRKLFDSLTGISASGLTEREICRLRPRVYEQLAGEANERIFLKIHDAFAPVSDEESLLSDKATEGAVYIIRNPLDVAVSMSHHMAHDIDRVISNMIDEEYGIDLHAERPGAQLPQHLGSWSQHVLSWLQAPSLRLHVVRYEDLKREPLEAFTGIASFVGWEKREEQIERAMRFSDFKELKKQEQEHGFAERSPQAASFFRKGEVGGWRNVLTEEQVRRIVQHHADVMYRVGYLSRDGSLLC